MHELENPGDDPPPLSAPRAAAMRTRRCRAVAWPFAASLMLLAACGGGSTPPPTAVATPSPPPAPPGRPVLIAPENDTVIPQNDPESGCPADSFAGAGARISFDWSDVEAPAGLAEYQIHVQREGATIPVVNTPVAASRHLFLLCNAFVADALLEGWIWRVRAVDRTGQTSDWAERRFAFAPCRLGRRPCGT
jgi:hypothetical protein